jgi:hypothetical protein
MEVSRISGAIESRLGTIRPGGSEVGIEGSGLQGRLRLGWATTFSYQSHEEQVHRYHYDKSKTLVSTLQLQLRDLYHYVSPLS